MSYVDGYVLPVPKDRVEDYRTIAEKASKIWVEHGALEYKECVAEDMSQHDYCASFSQVMQPKDNETIIFAYIVFKDRAHRDQVNAKVMSDPRMNEICDPKDMPFDCARMAYGGFKAIVAVKGIS